MATLFLDQMFTKIVFSEQLSHKIPPFAKRYVIYIKNFKRVSVTSSLSLHPCSILVHVNLLGLLKIKR